MNTIINNVLRLTRPNGMSWAKGRLGQSILAAAHVTLGFLFIGAAVNAQCPAPTANNQTSCTTSASFGANSTSSSVTNHIWYAAASGSTLSAVQPTFNGRPYPGATSWVSSFQGTLSTTTTVYVAAVCTSVESSRTAVTFTYDPGSNISIGTNGDPSNVCEGSGFTMTAQGGSGYEWSLNGTIISTATSLVPTQSGTYYLTGKNSCNETQTVSLAVTIYPLPLAAASDQTICSGQTVGITISNTNNVSGTYYQWNYVAQNVTGAASGSGSSISQTLTATATSTGYVTYTITPVANGCAGPAIDVVITVKPLPTTASAGLDQTGSPTCGLTSVTLAANTPEVGSGLWTVVSGSGGAFTNASSASSTFSGSAGATYTLRWTISNSPCTSSSDDVIIKFNQNPSTASAGSDQIDSLTCGLTSVTLAGNSPTVGTGLWTVVSGSGGSFTNASSPSSTFTGTAGVTYTLRWSIGNSPCASSSDDVVIKFNRNPSTASAGADRTDSSTCGLTSVTLAANTPTVGSGLWTVVSGSGGSFTNASSPSSTFNGTAGVTYTLRWTISNSPCTSSSDDVVVTFNRNPSTANAGPDQIDSSTCGLTSVTLAGSTPTVGSGLWTVVSGSDGSFTNASSPSSTFSGTAGASYVLRWTISNSPCASSTDEVSIKFNVFSNGGSVTPALVEEYGVATGQLSLGGYTGAIQKWQQKVGSGSWTDIANTTSILSYSNLTTATTYRAEVISGACAAAYSSEGAVVIHAVPSLIIHGESMIAPGGSTTLVTEAGQYSYVWFRNDVALGGDTSSTLLVKKPGNYKVSVKATSTAPVYTTGIVEIGEAISNQLTPVNYILSTVFLKEGVTAATNLYDLGAKELAQAVQYFDGLGRPMQTVSIGSSPAGNDMVQPIAYDAYGRETMKYLPYARGARDGRYVPDPLAAQSNFYQNAEKVAHDVSPFSETIFEPSPLNRVIEQGSPGDAWQPDAIHDYSSTDRSIKHSYEGNLSDEVLLWTPVARGGDTLVLVNATSADTVIYYDANSLYKNRTKDEHYNEVIEYVDKEGRTILKKVESDTSGYAQTYYIYDDFGNLVCVIPPEAVKNILESPSRFFGKTDAEKESFLVRWTFRYKYDARKRMIIKQVPGASPVYMVYDNRDRLVLTQDGNQRTTSPYFWTFTKYDALNRPILTGIKDTAAFLQQSEMQAVVNAHYAKAGAEWGEKYLDSEAIHEYTNVTYPLFTSGALSDPNHYLTVTYYDNYDFRDQWLDTYSYTDDALSVLVNDVLYEQPDLESLRVKGQVTGSKVKVLDGGTRGRYTWLKSVNYYDDRYRLIQSIGDNYKGGQEKVTTLYDFTGKVLKTKIHHTTNEISWTGLVNTVVVGNNLIKTALGAGWTAGGVTVEQLPAGVDGWIECIITEPGQKRAFGLTEVNEGEHRNTIDYAFWHDATAAAIFEDGSLKYTLPDVVKSGDVIRIERTGTTIKYYKNGVYLDSADTPSTTVLIGDASIDSGSGNILVPRASFNSKADSVMRRFTYDHAGRLREVWHQVNASPEVRITYNEYNELGQLIDKKLHSTDATASDAHQSVDYRYNIRGWLTDMNENNLANGDTGDPRDYFGFQLAYNNDAGIGNAPMYNGNISGMKWSTNLGAGEEKMNAYTYGYDKMNRITGATFKTGSGSPDALSWTTPADNSFSESGYSYDLNGNILSLNRKGNGGSDLDILTYEYGTGSAQSNRLLTVTDTGSKTEGFTEKISQGDDYVYDNNGNLVWDKNKGGEEVLVNGDFASGSANWVVTDPGGRLTFAEDSLKITAHGTESAQLRQNDIILRRAAYVVIVDMVREAGAIIINVGSGGNTSVNTSGKTVLTCRSVSGNDFVVNIPKTFSGRINSIEVKGIVVIDYNYLNLPEYISKGPQQQLGYIYDAAGRKISQEVYNEGGPIAKKSDYEGEFFYENDTLRFINHEEGRAVMADGAPEYQYHLKDHLGNVRLTFTTKPEKDESLATMETIHAYNERSQFLYYDEAIIVNYDLFDHTYDGTTGETYYSTRLTGGTTNAIYGLAKSLSVMPGDTINMEVFAKYLDPDANNWSSGLNDFMTAVAGGTAPPGTVVDGGSGGSIGGGTFPYSGMFDHSGEDPTAPKAYLNFIVFDRDFNPLIGESGFIRITTASKENGDNVPHDKLKRDGPLVIKQAGYVYIYLSNENETEVEVYFDDFRVEHIKSPVVQMDDYYPFGLTFNSYQRENSVENKSLYQNWELQNELDLNTYSTEFRSYDPALGRWGQIDPKASERESPYVGMANNPIRYIDPLGDTIRDNSGIVANYRTYVTNRVTALQGMLANENFDFAQYGTSREAVAGLVSGLQGIGGELDAMEVSEQIYNVGFANDMAAGEGGMSFNAETGEVNISFARFSGFDQSAGLVGHEMLHGYQFETGQVSMRQDNAGYGILYDIGDETAGYQREHLVAGGIGSGAHINNQWTRNFGASMTPPAYQTLPAGPIDINSTQGTYLRMSTSINGMLGRPAREAYKGWQNDYNRGGRRRTP